MTLSFWTGVAPWLVTNLQPQNWITAGGVAAAVLSFVIGQIYLRQQSRKQHTIKILFDSRLSGEFRKILDARRAVWREGEAIDPQQFEADLGLTAADILAAGDETAQKAAQARQDAAEAIRDLLNYYEFISLGILMRDLDEDLLRESLRGIMCRFVRDCHGIISAERRKNSRTLENLAAVYGRWRDDRYPALPPPPA